MPNAAAHFDDDFGYNEAARKKTPRKPRTKAATGRKNKGGWWGMGRVARYGAFVMSATVASGILYNALVAQKGHHPAPLFKAAPVVANRQLSVVSSPATKVAAPKSSISIAVAPDDANDPRDTPAPVARPRHATAQRGADQGDDPIARLLQTGSGTTTSNKSDSKTISGVQRALIKLGFVVKATGAMDSATRKAIESFERKQHMPVKGELTHRLVRVLSAESSLKIE